MGYNDLNSSKRHDWRTPADVLDLARVLLSEAACGPVPIPGDPMPPIPLDCATHPSNPTGALSYYDGADAGDGLMMPWDRPWWCNPPFGRALTAWAERAATAKAPGLFLAPARVDTQWWGRIYETADLVCFWRGRMRFLAPMVGPLQPGETRPAIALDPCPFPVQIAAYAGPCSDLERAGFVGAVRAVFGPHCNGFASSGAHYGRMPL